MTAELLLLGESQPITLLRIDMTAEFVRAWNNRSRLHYWELELSAIRCAHIRTHPHTCAASSATKGTLLGHMNEQLTLGYCRGSHLGARSNTHSALAGAATSRLCARLRLRSYMSGEW